MSALVSGQGAVFVSETATRSASAAGAFLSETVSTGGPVDFAGDLSFSASFAADVTPLRDLTGDLTVSVTFAADVVDIHDFDGALVSAVTFVADLTVGAAPPPPWTPADLGAGLLLWLDASDTSTVTVTGSGVSQWRDKSGNLRHANQATDANRPPYVSGQAVQMLDQKALLPVAGYPSAYDFVLAGKTYGTGIYRNWANTVSAHFPMVIANGLDRIGVFTTGFFQAGIQLWPVNTKGVVYGNVPAGSNESLALNGGSLIATTSFATNAVINAFGRSGTPQGFGDVYEVCLVTVGASLDTKQRLEGYLAWKWGSQALLPPTHPYAGAPPTQPQTLDLIGDLAPSVTFAADLDVVEGPRNYVDFSGNLGGVSRYGRLKYGLGHYSRGPDAFAPAFAAALDIVGQDFFDGVLQPVVSFIGQLGLVQPADGDLAVQVDFAADLSLDIGLAGDIAPQISLDGTLGLDLPLTAVDGSFGFTVVLEASELISHPLWEGSEPCPPPDWETTEPCPPPVWASVEQPPAIWTPTEKPSSLWTPVGPCDPVEWEETVE